MKLSFRQKNNKHISINICDLLNLKRLNDILKKKKPKLIIHLAAQTLVNETINKEKCYQKEYLRII